MEKFLKFQQLITPKVMPAVFVIGVICSIIFGIIMIIAAVDESDGAMAFGGIAYLLLGPLVVRMYCEGIIVFFQMNERLAELSGSQTSVDEQ